MHRRISLVCALFAVACGGSATDTTIVDAAQSDTGVADSGADAPPVDAASSDAACVDCLGSTVAWGMVGGLTASDDASSLTGCRTYTHRRHTNFGDAAADPACTIELAACAGHSGIGVAEVEAVLADADVQAALAKAPIVYGVDPRGYDGAVFELTIGSKVIDVGGPCTGGSSPSCVAIPAGVQRAVDFFRHLDETQLATPTCAGKF